MTNYLAGPATVEKTLYDVAFIVVFLLLNEYFRRYPVDWEGIREWCIGLGRPPK